MKRVEILSIFYFSILSNILLSCSGNKSHSNSQEHYINNIDAATVYEPLKQNGFKIDKQFGSDAIFVNCDKVTSEFSENIRISGTSPSEISEIRASYTNYSNGDINELALPILKYIASLPYENANPEKAQEWVVKNISKNAKNDINGVAFETFNNKNIRTLIVTPTKQN